MSSQPNQSRIPEPDPKVDTRFMAQGFPAETQRFAINALVYAEAERRGCTENDPGILRGMIGSGRTVRSLREQFRPLKWHREEPNSLPLVTSPDRKIALTVAIGDENTGRKDSPFARTKWRKGPMLIEWVSPSRQISLLDAAQPDADPFADEEQSDEVKKRPDLWMLLVRRTSTEILAELSHPTSVTKDNKLRFGDATRRIFLPPIPIDQTEPYDDEDDDYDVSPDVPVERL